MNTAALIENIRQLPTRASTWVMVIVTALSAWWLQLSPADQAAIFESFPSLRLVGPALSLAAFLVARAWPQKP